MLEEKHFDDTNKLLDEVLTSEPGFALPDNFADLMAEKMGRRFAWMQYLKEFLIYLGVIVGIAVASAAMALFWFDADWRKWLDFLLTNMTLVAGVNFLLVFVLFADRVLLRYFLFRTDQKYGEFKV